MRRIQRASRVHRLAESQVPASHDALEGGEKKKVRVTLRRAARRGLICILSQIGDSSGCSRTEIRLAGLEGIRH